MTMKNDTPSKEVTPWFQPMPLQRPGKTLEEASKNPPPQPRFRYAFRPPFVFDCRCYGGVQIKIDAIYKQFLSIVQKAVNEKKPLVDCAKVLNYQVDMAILKYGDNLLDFSRTDIKEDIKKAALRRFEKVLVRARENIASRYCGMNETWEDTELERRMGIGDIIMMIGMLQKIEAVVGFDNLLVIYDPEYPCYHELMTASGFNVLPRDRFASLDSISFSDLLPCPAKKRGGDVGRNRATLIPFRKHFLANRQGDTSVCAYGESEGFPGAQMLHDLGWERRISWQPFKVSLSVSAYNQKRADVLIKRGMGKYRGFVTANPLELTRGNRACTAQVWAQVMSQYNKANRLVIVGCTPEQVQQAQRFMNEVRDHYTAHGKRRIRHIIMAEDLMTWMGVINRAAHHFTGNNCGLWLGMATQTSMTIVSFQTAEHGTQWEPRAKWFSKADQKRIRIVNQINEKKVTPTPHGIGSF